MMLEEAAGYKMGGGGERDCKRTRTLFIDDLKVYSSGHQKLQLVNETITRTRLDVGAAYGVKKCAEIVIKQGDGERRWIRCSGGGNAMLGSREGRNIQVPWL